MATTDFTHLDQAASQRGAFDMLQRKFMADQYANVAAAPLPSVDPKDPDSQKAYDAALKRRADALESQQKIYSPDHHASLGEHLQALITGKQQQQAAATPPTLPIGPSPMPAAGAQAQTGEHLGMPSHPFQSSPLLAKIQHGIDALGQHLKAAANPTPQAPQQTDWKALASAPSAEDLKRQDAAAAQANAIKVAEARNTKAVWKPYKLPDGNTQYFDVTDKDSIPEGATAVVAGATPHLSQAALATYLRAKYGDNPTADQIEEGTKAHQAMMAGVTVGTHQALQFDDNGVPHVVDLHSQSHKEFGEAPVSSNAPQVPGDVNRAALADKLNRKKSQSNQLPQPLPSQLDFRKSTPAGTDAKKKADDAERAYTDVQKASPGDPSGNHLDPVGSQGILLSWLRGRVNRVTQSEINTINNLGGLEVKLEGNVAKIVKGTMSPQQYQWFLKSSKDNFETAKKIENERTGPPSKNAPKVPGETHEYAIDDKGKRRKVIDPKATLPAGWTWAD